MTRLVITSDTHEQHSKLHVPDGDCLTHCGDFTMIGEPHWIEDFNKWLGTLPHTHKLVVAGNHDRSLDIDPANALAYGQERLTNAKYLLNTGTEIEGLKFWGSPYTPFFASDYWKFHYDRAEGKEQWSKIPEGLDVLITHGPPDRILDRTLEGDYAGCFDLMERVAQVRPRHHVFGHIHEGFGHREWKGTVYHNVSAVDRLYRMRENPCLVLDL